MCGDIPGVLAVDEEVAGVFDGQIGVAHLDEMGANSSEHIAHYSNAAPQ